MEGNTEARYWDSEKEVWEVEWKAMLTVCDVYGTCGAFGSCNSMSSPICSCLEGFEPKNTEEWNRQNWTSGCERRTPLQCGRVNTSGKADKMDGLLKVDKMKVPDFVEWSAAQEDDCRQHCLQNCSCIAYALDLGTGCMTWNRSLIDTQQISNASAVDLYIRVAHSELVIEKIFASSTAQAKAKGSLTLGQLVSIAANQGCKSILFEGDAKVVIDALISSPSCAQDGPFERSFNVLPHDWACWTMQN
nr:g-type lectin s-receptor-like serine/threonine-protein kinase [Quercus suber]